MPIEFTYDEDSDNEEESNEEETEEDEEEENNEDENSEPEEYEEIEFSMTNENIAEWISELIRLKNEKESVVLPIDDELVLKINYEEGEDEED